jgi:exopolysaccharide biosynthesis polyprenyl glycosylphosphotransferase
MNGGSWKLRVADLLSLWLAVLIGFHFRFYSEVIPVFTPIPKWSLYLNTLLIISPFYVLVLGGLGNHRSRRGKISEYEIHNLFRSLAFFYLLCVSMTFFVRSYEFSRITLILSFFLNFLLSLIFRIILSKMQATSAIPDRVLLVGTNSKMISEIKTFFQQNPGEGTVVEIFDQEGSTKPNYDVIDRIIIVGGEKEYSDLADLIIHAPQSVRIDLIPAYHLLLRHLPFKESLGLYPVVPLTHQDLSGWNSFAKRSVDICISIVILGILSPFLFLILGVHRLLYGSPVFFRQERVGQNGRLFTMYKIRTMKLEAEQLIAPLVNSEKKPNYKWKDDPRVPGTFARFLRRTSLDEVPQFWNVLEGSMSLVGPRPAPVDFVQHYSAVQKLRLAIPPGMTGLQQIYCRGTDSMDEILRYDMKYIREQSFWLDLVILLKTIPSVVMGRGIQ